jgi:hypothetical protein
VRRNKNKIMAMWQPTPSHDRPDRSGKYVRVNRTSSESGQPGGEDRSLLCFRYDSHNLELQDREISSEAGVPTVSERSSTAQGRTSLRHRLSSPLLLSISLCVLPCRTRHSYVPSETTLGRDGS